MKFRKKPIEVEAIQVKEAIRVRRVNPTMLPFWLMEADTKTVVFSANHVTIYTLEGEMTGDNDDWIIRGIKGELYPCKSDIFDATYEPIEI